MEVFFMLDGLERTKENGYFFASNADLMLKSGIGSHHTLSKVIRTFEVYNFITRSVGSFEGRQATTYTLDMEAVMDWCEAHPIGAVSKRCKSASIKSASMKGAVSQKSLDEVIARLEAAEKKCAELEAVNKVLVEALSRCGVEAVEKALIGAGIGAVLEEVAEKCPTEPDTEKETTYHSVPEGNYREGDIYTRPDEVKNDEAGETVGSVCDFQKNRVEGVETPKTKVTTPNATANEIDTLNGDDDEAFLSTLEGNLRNVNTTLHPDEVIALSKRVAEIFTERVDDYRTPTSKKAAECFGLLLNHCKTLDSLAQLEKEVKGNLHHTNRNSEIISTAITIRRADIKEGTANIASGSVADTAEVQTTIDDEKTQQGASQRVNQGSGDIDTIPHDGETSQTSENKASGSVLTPQMGKLSTDTNKTRQTRPDEAREAFWKAITAEVDEEAAKMMNAVKAKCKAKQTETACTIFTNFIRHIDTIPTMKRLKYAKEVAERMRKEIGRQSVVFLNVAYLHIDRRKEALLAA